MAAATSSIISKSVSGSNNGAGASAHAYLRAPRKMKSWRQRGVSWRRLGMKTRMRSAAHISVYGVNGEMAAWRKSQRLA